MTIEDNELNEAELFDSTVSDSEQDASAAEVQQDEPATTEAAAEPETEGDRPAVDDNAPQVPSWRVREINDEKRALADRLTATEAEKANWQAERQELRRRLAALEKPPAAQAEEEPDPLLDPKGYREFMEKRLDDRLLNERREMSLQLAHRTYKGEFEEAYAAAQKGVDPALKAKMQNSRDPGETLIQWHREQKTMQEVGGDLNAFRQKEAERLLADPEFLAKALERARGAASPQTNGRPNVSLPPSLSSTSRANAAVRSGGDDVSDDELFRQTVPAD